MSDDGMLAIVPVKGISTRLPGKNRLLLGGLPMYLHSAYYARQEGVEPIVVTDAPDIAMEAASYGMRTLRIELPNDGDAPMLDAVRAAMAACPEEGCFALLQPTSPLRQPGMLRRMSKMLQDGVESAYTAPKVKPQGHLGSLYVPGYRDQQTQSWLYPFDGSIIVFTRGHVSEWGDMLSPVSVPVECRPPCTLQVDTAEDYELLVTLAESRMYRGLLAGRVGRKVVVVTNAPCSPVDYSALVEGADVVMRVNKMENVDAGFSGRRTDLVYITAGPIYLNCFSAEQRHEAYLREHPHCRIWYASQWGRMARSWSARARIPLWAEAPPRLPGCHSTTAGHAVALAYYLYPGCHVHFIGVISAAVRTHGHAMHSHSGETAWLASLVKHGLLTLHSTEKNERESV